MGKCVTHIFKKDFFSSNWRKIWKIDKKLDCKSYNTMYLISCQKDNYKEKYYIIQSKIFLNVVELTIEALLSANTWTKP